MELSKKIIVPSSWLQADNLRSIKHVTTSHQLSDLLLGRFLAAQLNYLPAGYPFLQVGEECGVGNPQFLICSLQSGLDSVALS